MQRGSIFLIALLGASALGMAQTQFAIFRNDGTVLQIPVAAIDSLTYSSPAIGTLAHVVMDPLSTTAQGIGLQATVSAADDADVLRRGFCYGTAPDPTTADAVIDLGIGTGDMEATMTGLDANNTYHVRAFATTLQGTAFSPSVAFTLGAGGGFQGKGVVDIDGNVYPTVFIGGLEWMAMNLRTAHYANGDAIPVPASNREWLDVTTGACGSIHQFRDFDHYDVPHGKHYNWYAVSDPRGVCPTGWRMPTGDELRTLMYHSAPDGVEPATLLLEEGPVHWGESNTATNATGFSAVPAGIRDGTQYGTIMSLNEGGYIWSGDLETSTSATSANWHRSSTDISGATFSFGLSVRCVRD